MKFSYRAIAIVGLAAILAQMMVGCEANSPNTGGTSAPPAATPAAPLPAAKAPPPQNGNLRSPQESQVEQNNNREGYSQIVENPFVRVSSSPLSTFSIDVDTASYSNVRRFINEGQLPPKDAVRLEEMINYFKYEYPQPTGDNPFSIATEISEAPWNPAHKLVQIGLQGKRLSTENLPPSNLVFLLDVSGSMGDANKLPLLKKSLQLLLNELRASDTADATLRDRVSIVVYAGSAGLVLPSTPEHSGSVVAPGFKTGAVSLAANLFAAFSVFTVMRIVNIGQNNRSRNLTSSIVKIASSPHRRHSLQVRILSP